MSDMLECERGRPQRISCLVVPHQTGLYFNPGLKWTRATTQNPPSISREKHFSPTDYSLTAKTAALLELPQTTHG